MARLFVYSNDRRNLKTSEWRLRHVLERVRNPDLLYLRWFVNSLKGKPYFNDSFTECWAKMTVVRSSSLCSTCSARSDRHFERDRALVSEELCGEVLGACASPMGALLKFVRMIDLFVLQNFGVFKEVNELKNHPVLTNLQILENVVNQEKSSQISLAVDSFRQAKESNSPDLSSHSATLCGKLLKLSHRSFLESTFSFFNVAESSLRVIVDFLVASLEASLGGGNTNWSSSGRRRLNAIEVAGNLFVGDVKMMPAGAIFSNRDTAQIGSLPGLSALPVDPSKMLP